VGADGCMNVVAGSVLELPQVVHARGPGLSRDFVVYRLERSELDVAGHGYAAEDRHHVVGGMLGCLDEPQRLAGQFEKCVPFELVGAQVFRVGERVG
jgi:hypothetical protein